MRAFWYRLLSDLATRITVSDLKSKEQRAAYLDRLTDVIPSEAERRPARRFEEAGKEDPDKETGRAGSTGSPNKNESSSAGRPSPVPKTQRPRPMRLFHGLRLVNVQPKVKDILREAQRIDLSEFPNAGAVLIRVTVELVVAEGIQYIDPNADDRLKERIKRCLRELDPSQSEQKYAGIRSGLSDPNSLFAVRAMHSYLHNPQMHADATSLRAISENYIALLRDIDGLIGDRSGT